MKHRRTTPTLAVVSAIGLILMGCGGDGSGSQAATDGTVEDASDGDESPSAEVDDPVELRVSVLLPPGQTLSKLSEWYVTELEERTDGAVTGEVSFGGSLLSGIDTLPGVQEGRAEMGLVVQAYFPNELPLGNSNQVPLPEINQSARARAYQQLYEENDAFRAEFEDAGLVPLGFMPGNASTLALTDPIESIDDLAGRRIRIPSDPLAAVYTELGVEPVFQPSEEVYESLQRDIVDGVTYPFDTQVGNGVTEVAPYLLSDVGESGGAVLAINAEVYDSLPAEVQETMRELTVEFYEEADRQLVASDEAACDEFLSTGGQVLELPAAEREEVSRSTQELAPMVWKDSSREAGLEAEVIDTFWDELLTGVEEIAPTVAYENGLEQCAMRE